MMGYRISSSMFMCICWTGVWGSAFSILFNRVLGMNDVTNGSTMEEELGKIMQM